uniref:serine/threonine-protein phosphatase 6 regulatory ankyrin repeat subunit A-like isoform X1 n=1 Tax=Fragaria vesca subsp. vesca TaxID=101020 RepID=UPI0005C7EAE3|nr:PREDICTED: serine/threonine-protein phosphatase 6 regulatory ankyrin repeat subunit A-like isoform X1 [Fragaria vesca subsp. vesca]
MDDHEKLVQVSEQEVRIDFALNQKCRANVTLTSLISTCPVAFKVQTSSPHKFLVKPPTGVIPPSSSATFQVILKPQPHLPPSFPRSPSDRFLIKAARLPHPSADVNAFFKGPRRTSDLKLKVAFVGPVLLKHAVRGGDLEAVRNIIRRQRTVLAEMRPAEAEELLRVATGLDEPERMINLLLEAGLRIEAAGVRRDAVDERRVAEASDRFASVLGLREAGPSKGEGIRLSKDHGRRRVGTGSDKLELGEKLLMAARIGDLRDVELLFLEGADISYCDQYGLTALHAAAIKGHKEVVQMLVEFGLDLESRDGEGHAPLHLAVVGGNLETVEMLIQNGANVNAKSKSGATPLYMATAMGYDDIIEFLISRGG